MSLEEVESVCDPVILRAELKKWETAFRAANQGRKPGRADIKNDATIAAKYKQYERATKRTEPQPTLIPPAETPKKSTARVSASNALRERPHGAVTATPKRTPSKPKHISALSPIQEPLPTPAFVRNALGPTPQKDGQVLGIFDITFGSTPARQKNAEEQAPDVVILGTPSKTAPISSETPLSKTPQSVGKRYFLDSFVGTPLKRKRDDDTGTASSSKRKFATPSFLRRSFPLAPINEDGTESASMPAPFRKRGLVRSLSSIIKGLKKQENDEADHEWEIMNEIEEEDIGVESRRESGQTVLAEDSQTVQMPLGPDQAPESDQEASGAGDQSHTRKPWKKKGLKRQTRRVIMRPVLHKARKAESDNEPEDEGEIVPDARNQDFIRTDEYEKAQEEDSDYEHRDAHETSATTSNALPKTSSTKTKSSAKGTKQGHEHVKKPRKVNPDAHANFRKLKIKNKNSKANGRGRKFGRR